ncbi:MAG TPA: IS630 transposase-related protein [Candidatus Competibacter sp.]|jgi:transposase|nr:IS630 transposase-related protein [Candidatus Competibacter sp.]HRX60818.1 IS630 transposase-related protein [Candidatus Competibacter sp.]
MTYGVDLWKKVVGFVHEGGSQAEAARRFDVSLWCVRDWRARKDLRPEQTGVSRQRKLDRDQLRARVRDHPDATLQEHAAFCGVDRSVIGKALKHMKITRKKRPSNTQNAIQKNV